MIAEVKHDMTAYTITRSSRKTIALYVRDGGVEIRAPLRISKAEIDRFVTSKQAWIDKRLAQSAASAEKRGAFAVNFGSRIPYRGTDYLVGGVPGRKAYFDGCFCVPLNLAPEQIKAVCIQLYRRLARAYISERVAHYAALMNVSPTAIKINGATTRWGSCSAKKSLNFSWRLIMADDAVIDYVVVHELAHITELNHSVRFWAIVADILPDCRGHSARLQGAASSAERVAETAERRELGVNNMTRWLRLTKTQYLGFFALGLAALLLQELPYFIMPLIPLETNPLMEMADKFAWLNFAEKAVGVSCVITMLFLVRAEAKWFSLDTKWEKLGFFVALTALLGYYIGWTLYFLGIQSLAVIFGSFVAMPPLYYAFIGVWRRNPALFVLGLAFLCVHLANVSVNFL